MNLSRKKVFVSGCYDMLHSGHIAFFEEAATWGDVYVGIGSDKTIFELKNQKTIFPEAERLYMVKALKFVKDAWINSGGGIMDFETEFRQLKPDIFLVNFDGDSKNKRMLCEELGVEYKISSRIPHQGLPARSTTELRKECNIPYRLDLAGGWLDQPFVSKFFPGPVITVNIEPHQQYSGRSGMSTSSRQAAIDMWGTDLPEGDYERIAKMIFRYENPPGTKYVSGSQDSIGITFPGLNLLEYDNDYWPHRIETVLDDDILDFIEKHIWLVPLYPRKAEFDPLFNTHIDREGAKALSDAAYDCWTALLNKDIRAWGDATIRSFKAQIRMFPEMTPPDVLEMLAQYQNEVLGYKMTGAGGGGYLILINDQPVKHAIQVRIKKQ